MMTDQSLAVLAFVLAWSLGTGLSVTAEPRALLSVFTTEQATAGQTTYEEACIGCHQVDLGGQNEALPLKGPHFFTSWGERTTRDLFVFLSTSMPPGQSTLSEREYLGLMAFLLQSNGATAGSTALMATTSVPIRAIVPRPKGEPH